MPDGEGTQPGVTYEFCGSFDSLGCLARLLNKRAEGKRIHPPGFNKRIPLICKPLPPSWISYICNR